MLRFIAVLFSAGIVACASGPQTGEPRTTADAEPTAQEGAPAGAPSIDEKRGEFVEACIAKAGNREFCECSFNQFREVFAGTDLDEKLEGDDPRLKDLQGRVITHCAGTIPEATVRDNFLEGCVANDARKEVYCNCAWPALREQLSAVELMQGGREDARFLEAKKAMVVKCKGKFPEEVAEEEFMAGCMQSKGGEQERCKCLWGKVSGSFTMEEIAAGTVDVSSAEGLATCQ